MTDTHLSQTRLDSLALDPRILAGLAETGFIHCTPIQAETLPIALEGHDIAGQAQTGTGKTAAFLLATMQRLLGHPAEPRDAADTICRPRALILAPTRELAVQIHKDALALGAHTGLRLGLAYGGTGYQKQRDELAAGVDILIGTPGRLIDYFKQRVFDLRGIEVVVLDEADRMFDLGFIKDIRFLLRRMPPPESRQGLLFSATLSYRVTELAYEHMNQPRLIKIETEQVTADRVRQCCYMTANEEKIPLLVGLARGWLEGDARIMVFVNTKREADRVWGYLQGNGINTAVLSGDVPQKQRLRLLREFTEGSLPVLVGTDVAARGLHIPDVTHVVNFDLPEDPEDYVHRVGRTARAGAAGDAVGFVCETYAFCLPDIEAYIDAKITVEPVDPGLLAEVDPGSRLRPERARRDGHRSGERGERGHGERDGRRRSARPRSAEPVAESEGSTRDASTESSAQPPRPRRRRSTKVSDAPASCALTDPATDPAPQPPTETDASQAEAPRKRRRRRRRKPSTSQETGVQSPKPEEIEPVD